MTIEYIHPDELRKHSENTKLYGDTPDQELVDSVKAHGVFEDHPIGYVMDGDFRRIVSGHRRHQAARLVKLDMVPCVRLTELEGDELAIKEHLVLSNKHRNKSNEVLAREANFLAEIEVARAASRKQQGTSIDLRLQGDEGSPAGRTDEIVGEKLGVGKKKARALIAAGKALNDAEKRGQKKRAARIKKGLKKSASAGAAAARPQVSKDKDRATTAATLLAKVTGDFKRAADNLAPLCREWDAMKAAGQMFDRKHAALMGHHSILFQVCENGKRALQRLNETWKD